MPEDNSDQTVHVILGLALGLANVIVASQNTEASGECGSGVWEVVLALGINDLILCLVRICAPPFRGNFYSGIISLGLAIWALAAFYDMSDDCEAFYKDEHRNLYNMLLADVIIIIVGFCLVVLVSYCQSLDRANLNRSLEVQGAMNARLFADRALPRSLADHRAQAGQAPAGYAASGANSADPPPPPYPVALYPNLPQQPPMYKTDVVLQH